LGGIDKPIEDVEQSIACDFITFTDDNFPPRFNSMTPRLQAKIPKCFAWQLKPDYDFYLWLDGNLRLADPKSLEYYYNNCKDYDVVVLQHPRRDTVYWEYRYNYRGLHSQAPSNYLTERYTNEFLDEQYQVIKDDKDFQDDLLVNGGVFMYRNTPEVHKMLKEWWYHVSRYLIMDQLSWAYVLKKSGLRVNVLPDDFGNCRWIDNKRHRVHG
jgi:hypothetical protein